LQKALALAGGASAHERDYLEALSKRYSSDPHADLQKLAVDYKNAMGELVRRYPDDLDAATLYAESLMNLRPWKLWTADGKPTEGTGGTRRHTGKLSSARPNPQGAKYSLLPRGWGPGDPGPGPAAPPPPRQPGSRLRPPRPHAVTHLHPHGRLRGCRPE